MISSNLGSRWRHTYSRSIKGLSGTHFLVYRPGGKIYSFKKVGDEWKSDADITDKLTQLRDPSDTRIVIGWRYYVDATGEIETYNLNNGTLLSIADRFGRTLKLNYNLPLELGGDNNLKTLDVVTDDIGRQLRFTYDSAKRVASLIDPAGGITTYTYDTNSNLGSVTYPDNTSKTYHYENPAFKNALTGITDQNGVRYATYNYDSAGRATSEFLAGGVGQHSLNFDVDASGNPVSTTVIDPLGTARTHNFTTILGVVKSTGQSQPGGAGCGAASSATTYDANGNVASRADFNGNKSCYAYDLTRNLETARVEGLAAGLACPGSLASYVPVANTAERKILTDWHPTYRLPVKVTEAGRETTTSYDSRGNLASQSVKDTVTQAVRSTTVNTVYHPSVPGVIEQRIEDGPRTDVADRTTTDYYLPDENCTGGHFGCRAQVRQITNALGHVTQLSRYNAHGQVEELIDPNTLVTTLSYDPRQRLTQRNVGSETTQYDYDAVGQLKQVTLPTGGVVRYDYDPAHRLTDIWDEEGNRIRYTLDAIGNRTQEDTFNAQGVAVSTKNRVFDALNRLWQDIGAVNAATGNRPVTSYGYDANGNLKSIAPPGQPVTTQQYDALNRLFLSTDALGGVSQYRYDPLDQLREVRDPRNVTTGYDVNAFGESTRVTSPDSGITNKTYDEAGNLKTSTDARGKQSSYSYDALNRLTGISSTSGNPISFGYDQGSGQLGRLGSMSDETGTTQWQYDPIGRVTLKTVLVGGTPRSLAYHYDPQGRLDQLTYPSGKVVGLTWRASKLDGLSLDGQPVLSGIQYHPFGGPRQWTLGNGRLVTRSYDANNRLAGYPLADTTRSLVFDDAGRITRIDASNPAYTQNMGYDNLDRLTNWTTQLLSQGYSYDAGSNRTATVFGGTASYSHSVAPTSNRLQSIAGPTAKTYQYDAAGNVIHDGRTSFGYNDRGRLPAPATRRAAPPT